MRKKITGDWKPTKVTSNCVSHSRLCSPVIYKQFEENAAVASKRKAEAECPSIRNFFRISLLQFVLMLMLWKMQSLNT